MHGWVLPVWCWSSSHHVCEFLLKYLPMDEHSLHAIVEGSLLKNKIGSLAPRPSSAPVFDHHLQSIKNWSQGRLESKAT